LCRIATCSRTTIGPSRRLGQISSCPQDDTTAAVRSSPNRISVSMDTCQPNRGRAGNLVNMTADAKLRAVKTPAVFASCAEARPQSLDMRIPRGATDCPQAVVQMAHPKPALFSHVRPARPSSRLDRVKGCGGRRRREGERNARIEWYYLVPPTGFISTRSFASGRVSTVRWFDMSDTDFRWHVPKGRQLPRQDIHSWLSESSVLRHKLELSSNSGLFLVTYCTSFPRAT